MPSKSQSKILWVFAAVCLTGAPTAVLAGGPTSGTQPPILPPPINPPLDIAHGNNPPLEGGDGDTDGAESSEIGSLLDLLTRRDPQMHTTFSQPLMDYSVYDPTIFKRSLLPPLDLNGADGGETHRAVFSHVPAPGPLALIGLSALSLHRRRRRAAG